LHVATTTLLFVGFGSWGLKYNQQLIVDVDIIERQV
jgi:hypothetical protein